MEREGPAAQARRQTDGDLLELADASVAHQFAGQAEPPVAALLGAGLEHDLVVAHGLDQPLAFVDGQRQRFLAVDVLLRLATAARLTSVCQ